MTKEATSALDFAEAEDEDLVRVVQMEPSGPRRRRAATELFGRYQSRVYVWCFRMVKDHEDALDLAQDALLSAYRALPGFRADARFSSWLFAIARNRCLSAVRPVSLLRDDDADLERLAHPDRPVDQRLEEDQEGQRLLALMNEVLEPVERQALALRCFERLSVDAITEQLALTNATGARALLQKARRKLRAALEARGGPEGGDRS